MINIGIFRNESQDERIMQVCKRNSIVSSFKISTSSDVRPEDDLMPPHGPSGSGNRAPLPSRGGTRRPRDPGSKKCSSGACLRYRRNHSVAVCVPFIPSPGTNRDDKESKERKDIIKSGRDAPVSGHDLGRRVEMIYICRHPPPPLTPSSRTVFYSN